MSDPLVVTCGACGAPVYVTEPTLVEVAIPAALYDKVIRLVARNLPPDPTRKRRKPRSDGPTREEIQQAGDLHARGLTVRQIAAETGWTTTTAYRRIKAWREQEG